MFGLVRKSALDAAEEENRRLKSSVAGLRAELVKVRAQKGKLQSKYDLLRNSVVTHRDDTETDNASCPPRCRS